MKIKNLKDKLTKYFELQSKINDNEKIETQLLKSNQRLTELDNEKNGVIRQMENGEIPN